MERHAMFRQVGLLASAQALFQTASVLVMTVGGLAGGRLADDPGLATAPIAAMFLGTALVTVPASLWMARAGRRAGFLAGASLGVAGGLLAALGLWLGSLPLLCLGTMLVGGYQGFAQFYRFAASEVAEPAFRPRAISLVLAGGIVAALLGPALARAGAPLFGGGYIGSFLLLALVSLFAVLVLLKVRIPVQAADGVAGGRPLSRIMSNPTYLVALFSAATGYGIMILAMTATPLAMSHHNHGDGASATVIQFHVLGMFVPSFFTGVLIARFSVMTIMLTGTLLFGIHILLALSGTGFYSFTSALVFLGIGWNFLYVGGTTLLTQTYSTAEKGKAQAANDLVIFTVGLCASLGAGAMLEQLGWQGLNLALLPWLALAMALILWHRIARRDAITTDQSPASSSGGASVDGA